MSKAEELMIVLPIIIVWVIVYVVLLAIAKALDKKAVEKRDSASERFGHYYLTNSDFAEGLLMFWPIWLVLSPLFVLYKLTYKIAIKIIEKK